MHAGPPVTALQLEYSLVERAIEAEYVPLAREFGIAIQPWGAIGGGFLTGKYTRDGAGTGRLAGPDAAAFRALPETRWAILDAVREVAAEIGATPAQLDRLTEVSAPALPFPHGILARLNVDLPG
jgi:aryl-alcohol dehydrogenase-like predicted oxidoreductase